MKLYLLITKYYLNLLSLIAPNYGGKIAIQLFSTIRNKKIKDKEKIFFEKATHHKIERFHEDLHYYEYGNTKGKILVLVHGWESNAGSLVNIASAFEKTHRIISIGLPAHGKTHEKTTNLYTCKVALKLLIEKINPKGSIDLIAHSFGSAVSTYAFSELDITIDKMILLSSNNKMEQVFLDFQKLIGFNQTIYKKLKAIADNILEEDLTHLHISKKLKTVQFNNLLYIHDKKDKIIPYYNALEFQKEFPNEKFLSYEKIGHYRMLWNEEVLTEIKAFLN